jgi:hypothetical protein
MEVFYIMKKKFFTVALATTMALSTVMTATAETKDFTVGTAFEVTSGEEQLTGDFDVTYTFHCNGYKAEGEAWETFAVEVTNVGIDSRVKGTDCNFLTAVVGNQNQWWYNDGSAATQWAGDFTSSYSDSDKTLAVLADADVVCNIVRSGEKLTIKATCTGTAGTSEYSLETTNTAGFGDTVNVHITGEDCEVSNIVFKNNAATGETPTTAAPSTEQATTAAPSTTTTTTPKTADVAPVAALAAVAVVACAGVVVSRKKVTE